MIPSSGSRSPYEHLFVGVVFLATGVVTEVTMHPVVPWSYLPGPLFTMIGLGIGTGALEHYRPRPGVFAYYLTLTAIGIWWLVHLTEISYLAPATFVGLYQLTRCVLKLAVPEP